MGPLATGRVRTRAVVLALGLTLAWQLALAVLVVALPPLRRPVVQTGAIAINLLLVVLELILVARLGWWRDAGLRRGPIRARTPSGSGRARVALLALLGIAVVPLAAGAWAHPGPSALGAVVLYAVLALDEELLSRGLVQRVLDPCSPVWSVATTGLLFGLGHLSNLWLDDQGLLTTGAQVISNVAFGVAFAAVRRRLATIWWLVALHAVGDVVLVELVATPSRAYAAVQALLYLVLAAVLLWREPRGAAQP